MLTSSDDDGPTTDDGRPGDGRRRVTGDGSRKTDDGRPGTDGRYSQLTYEFQKLEIYQLALEYIDLIYALAQKLPRHEDFNLKSQITRAATSITLNIAEGSTGQSDPEQSRFLGMALRSLIETVACQDIIRRRRYVTPADLEKVGQCGVKLFAKIQSMRRALSPRSSVVRRPSNK